MLRKTLSLGMAFILVISLLLVSMIACFTYDADAHPPRCWIVITCELDGLRLVNCEVDIGCTHDAHGSNPTGD